MTESPEPKFAAIFDVIVVGHACVDLFLTPAADDKDWRLNAKTNELSFKHGEKISVKNMEYAMGGNGQNVAIGLARLGYNVALMEEIGDDAFAHDIFQNLQAEKVDTRYLNRTRGEKTSIGIVLNVGNDRTILSQHVEHQHSFKLEDVATRLIYLTSLGPVWQTAYKTVLDFAEANGVPIAFNPGSSQFNEQGEEFWRAVKHSHIICLNLDEAQKILESAHPKADLRKLTVKEVLTKVSELGPKIVVITDGKNGAYARAEDGRCFQQGLVPAEVVERTGAGDSFTAGVLGAALSGKSLQKAMYWGAKNAASVVSRVGAQPGLLTREQIEAEMNPILTNLGCTSTLAILPFDQRIALTRQLLNTDGADLSESQLERLQDIKQVIYAAAKEAIVQGVPQSELAIMVDEPYGAPVLDEALKDDLQVMLPVEKDGQVEFEYAYGDQFGAHIDKFKPAFVKALAYYNPGESLEVRRKLQTDLKTVSDYSHHHGSKFLLEVVIEPTQKQLEKAKGSAAQFEKNHKPEVTIKAIHELQMAGIEPDVWKFEYFEGVEQYQKVIKAIQRDGREKVGLVISGHGSNKQDTYQTFDAVAKIPGVIGFAADKSLFWDAISDYYHENATREQAKNRIAQEFVYLYQQFAKAKQSESGQAVASHPETEVSPEMPTPSESPSAESDRLVEPEVETNLSPEPVQDLPSLPHRSWAQEAIEAVGEDGLDSSIQPEVEEVENPFQAAEKTVVDPAPEQSQADTAKPEQADRKGVFARLFKR